MRCRVLHVCFMSLVFYLPWAKGGDPSRERAILNRLLNSTYDATIRPEAAEGEIKCYRHFAQKIDELSNIVELSISNFVIRVLCVEIDIFC